ncbi:MAG: hypothetical protein GMKNLPBB_01420 [Myxococcota bacterium]|nr:hypothetical protein [Myxococcota bacterium]
MAIGRDMEDQASRMVALCPSTFHTSLRQSNFSKFVLAVVGTVLQDNIYEDSTRFRSGR